MTTKLELLSTLPFLKGEPYYVLRRLVDLFEPLSVPKGQVLCAFGQKCDSLYLVKEGDFTLSIRVSAVTMEAHEKTALNQYYSSS